MYLLRLAPVKLVGDTPFNLLGASAGEKLGNINDVISRINLENTVHVGLRIMKLPLQKQENIY